MARLAYPVPPSVTPPSKRVEVFSIPAAAANVYFTVGMQAPSAQKATSTIVFRGSPKQRFERFVSTTSLGAQAGVFSTSNPIATSDVDFTLYFRFGTDTALTNLCIWLGAVATQPTFNNTTPPNNSAAAYYVQGTNTRLMATGKATGSASAGVAFGPALAVSKNYVARCRHVAGVGTYWSATEGTELDVDFGPEVLVTTAPTAGVGLGWVCQGGAYTAGTAVTFLWSLTRGVLS